MFSPRGRGVQHFLQALVYHVAVALDGDHKSVGQHPLDPGGHRWCPTVQGLNHLHVEVVGEGGVAPDSEHRDGLLGQPELCHRLHCGAHGNGFPATGTEVVIGLGDERGCEVVHQRCWLCGRLVGGDINAVAAHGMASRMRSEISGTLISGTDPETGVVPTRAPDKLHRHRSQRSQAHVVDHLTHVSARTPPPWPNRRLPCVRHPMETATA